MPRAREQGIHGMTWFLVAAVVVTVVAAWTDWRTGHIPNWLTLGALGLAPFGYLVDALLRGATKQEAITELSLSIVGGFVCGIIPLLLYRQSAIGGGDVKLFVALGAILQFRTGVEAEMYGFFAAAIIAPARLAYDGKLFRTIVNAFFLAANPILPKAKRRDIVPEAMSWFRMGPAILVGTIFTALLHWRAP